MMLAIELLGLALVIGFTLWRTSPEDAPECPTCHAEEEWCVCDLMLELEEPAFRRFGEED